MVARRFSELEAIVRLQPEVSARLPPFAFAPLADLIEGESELLVELAVPGVERSDVHVEVRDGVVEIAGVRRGPATNGRGFRHADIPRGPFRRAIRCRPTRPPARRASKSRTASSAFISPSCRWAARRRRESRSQTPEKEPSMNIEAQQVNVEELQRLNDAITVTLEAIRRVAPQVGAWPVMQPPFGMSPFTPYTPMQPYSPFGMYPVTQPYTPFQQIDPVTAAYMQGHAHAVRHIVSPVTSMPVSPWTQPQPYTPTWQPQPYMPWQHHAFGGSPFVGQRPF